MSDGWALGSKLLSSDAKAELLRLSHNDRKITYRAEETARHIGRSKQETEGALKDLLESGILKQNSDSISLDEQEDQEIQTKISNYLEAIHPSTSRTTNVLTSNEDKG